MRGPLLHGAHAVHCIIAQRCDSPEHASRPQGTAAGLPWSGKCGKRAGGKPVNATCVYNSDCENDACGSINFKRDKYICCPKGLIPGNTKDYCADLNFPSGAKCNVDGECQSGNCKVCAAPLRASAISVNALGAGVRSPPRAACPHGLSHLCTMLVSPQGQYDWMPLITGTCK